MTDEKKKDLTRIEDLSEYLHSDADNFTIPELETPVLEDDTPPPPPFEYKNEEPKTEGLSEEMTLDEADAPPEEIPSKTEEVIEQNFTSEESTDFQSTDFQSTDFGSAQDFGASTDFTNGETETTENNWDNDLNAIEEMEEPTFTAQEQEPTQIMSMGREEALPTPSFLKEVEEKEEVIPPESFKDVKEFGQNISYTNLAAPGNPPFSVIIKDIKYSEDVEDIMILFKELGVVKETEWENAQKALNRGAYLVPRISEFAAIFLCHKLRRFDLSILMGLADEIHPSKSFSSEDRGLVSKLSLKQNQKHFFDFKKTDLQFDDIICTTSSQIHTHEILQYLGPLMDSEIIELSEYFSHTLNQELLESVSGEHETLAAQNATLFQNRLAANSHPFKLKEVSTRENKVTIQSLYAQMLDRLKLKALSNKGNGIMNVHYQLVPLVLTTKYETPRYQISCSGDLVWLKKN